MWSYDDHLEIATGPLEFTGPDKRSHCTNDGPCSNELNRAVAIRASRRPHAQLTPRVAGLHSISV